MSLFQFQQFTIHQNQAALKVGTDGVLLGAWVQNLEGKHVLDIGCGTGLISLMLAQKGARIISSIDISKQAILQSRENFDLSKWKQQFELTHIALANYKPAGKFHHIVSNPPFHRGTSPEGQNRNWARNQKELGLSEILAFSRDYLKDDACLSLILPYQNLKSLEQEIQLQGFSISRLCKVSNKPHSEPIRYLLELKRGVHLSAESGLSLRNLDDSWSEDYKDLTRDYYLSQHWKS